MVDSEDKFFLQWREFEGNVRASYKNLLSSGDFSDVTLASRDGHRVKHFLTTIHLFHPSPQTLNLSLVSSTGNAKDLEQSGNIKMKVGDN